MEPKLDTCSPIGKNMQEIGKLPKDVSTNPPKNTYYEHARSEILELIPPTAHRVLDVGCGAGALGSSVKSRQTAEIHGVELVSQVAEVARTRLDKVLTRTIEDALPELSDSYYDCIVIADVLEHLVDPWAVLCELKNKLAPEGKIVASLPNIQNWEILSDLIQGRWDYRDEGILDRTHLRFFTRKSVEELFWGAGFRIAFLSPKAGGTPPPTSFLKNLKKTALTSRELERDGHTFQFLVIAEIPLPTVMPKISIVILNWNGETDTLECLESVQKIDYPSYEVVVVDNGSTDNSVATIKQQYPSVILLETGENIGYAGGNNVGIRHAMSNGAEYILLLNNDTIVDPHLLSRFVNAARIVPQGGIFTGKIYFHSEPEKIWYAGAKWMKNISSFNHVGFGTIDNERDFNAIVETDYASGCALFVKAAVINEIGLLDEKFFLTYEETDWCYRARAAGHKCLFVPTAKVWHKVSASFGGAESPLQLYFYSRNILLWAERHLPRSDYWRLFRKTFHEAVPFSTGNRNSGTILKRWFWAASSLLHKLHHGGKDPIARAKYLGFRDYILRRFGDCPREVRTLKVTR